MKLVVEGKSDSLSRREVRSAFTWAVRKLLGTRVARAIDARVTFKDMGKDAGDTVPYYHEGERVARKFVVSVSREMKRRRSLRTLFHEAAHVMQFAKGVLFSSTEEHSWCWKKMKNIKGPYYQRPWEVEARRIENELEHAYRSKARGEQRRVPRPA